MYSSTFAFNAGSVTEISTFVAVYIQCPSMVLVGGFSSPSQDSIKRPIEKAISIYVKNFAFTALILILIYKCTYIKRKNN